MPVQALLKSAYERWGPRNQHGPPTRGEEFAYGTTEARTSSAVPGLLSDAAEVAEAAAL